MASRSIDQLTKPAAEKCRAWVLACMNEGVDVLVYCTHRSETEQAELYASGRTKPGPILTNARPGESAHQKRIAWDAVPMVNGKPAWNDRARYAVMGEVAGRLGIEWAGNWRGKLKETAHFQVTE